MHTRALAAAFTAVVMMAGAAFAAPGDGRVTAVSGSTPAAGATPPDPQSVGSRTAGTWGACGSWWSETAAEISSGGVCGVDGLVADNGQATQLAEPLVSVFRYVCFKRQRAGCRSESFQGTVRHDEMTVDPLLRRASIRGVLGGCALDVEFAGIGPARSGGNMAAYHSLAGGPQVSIGGAETFTSDARWWGGVCGQTVVVDEGRGGQASMFRGVEASISGFGGAGGCECS
jgi:hypothetical protein